MKHLLILLTVLLTSACIDNQNPTIQILDADYLSLDNNAIIISELDSSLIEEHQEPIHFKIEDNWRLTSVDLYKTVNRGERELMNFPELQEAFNNHKNKVEYYYAYLSNRQHYEENDTVHIMIEAEDEHANFSTKSVEMVIHFTE
ncbi:MAG: hypothetical protein OCD76_17550 [Reichenbachiella sp.]